MWAAILSILGWLFSLITGKSAAEKLGQQESLNSANKHLAEDEGKALDEQNKIVNMSDAAVDAELRDKFTRK